jgi:hypothetical protein
MSRRSFNRSGEVLVREPGFLTNTYRRAADITAGTYVDRWYDKHSRNWVVQLKDRNGNQIGSADYVGTAACALYAAQQMAEQWQCTCGKTVGRHAQFCAVRS